MSSWVKLFAAAGVLALVAAAGADEKKPAKKSDDKPLTDADFVKMVGSANQHEIALGEVGQIKGTHPAVVDFARRMVIDHVAAGNELRRAADSAGQKVPDKMEAEHQKEVDRFKNYKGDNFDADYMKHMLDDHEKAVKLFTRAAKELKDQRLKTFAERTLPMITAHRDMAKAINEQVKKK